MAKDNDRGIIVPVSEFDTQLLEDYRKREGLNGAPLGVGEAAAKLLSEGLRHHMLSSARP